MAATPEIVCLEKGSLRQYLLWESREAEPDRYIAFPATTKLIVAKTISEALEVSSEIGRKIIKRPKITKFDIKDADNTIAKLRPGRLISQNACATILDTWNLLDDLWKSAGGAIQDEVLQETANLYEKIFAGNNLPSMTPKGKKYEPILNIEELRMLRHLFQVRKAEILQLCPALTSLKN